MGTAPEVLHADEVVALGIIRTESLGEAVCMRNAGTERTDRAMYVRECIYIVPGLSVVRVCSYQIFSSLASSSFRRLAFERIQCG